MVPFSNEDRQEDNTDMDDTVTGWTESPAGLCGNWIILESMNELVKEFDKYKIYMPCKKLDCQREEKVIRRIIKFYIVDIKVTWIWKRSVY